MEEDGVGSRGEQSGSGDELESKKKTMNICEFCVFSIRKTLKMKKRKSDFGVPGQRGKIQAIIPVGLAREGNLLIIGSAGLA